MKDRVLIIVLYTTLFTIMWFVLSEAIAFGWGLSCILVVLEDINRKIKK